MTTFQDSVSDYVNSINLNHKVFALCFMLMSFVLVMSFVGVIVYLNLRRCRLLKINDEEKSKSFTFQDSRGDRIQQFLPDLLSGFVAPKAASQGQGQCQIDLSMNYQNELSILSDGGGMNETIRLNADNVHDDFEFYEIRSDISTEFCDDINNQVKWETLIKQNVLRVPPKSAGKNTIMSTMPRNYSNVRRCLLDEFNFTDASTM